MRIGTWNLEARWNTWLAERVALLQGHDCDVWLLTEVSPKAKDAENRIAGFHCHLSAAVMNVNGKKQHWAAVLSREAMRPLDDPHPASASAVGGGITFCSSILPWRGSGSHWPWAGKTHADKTEAAVAELMKVLPSSDLVWGGDWNHSLKGKEVAGSKAGRKSLLAAIEALKLKVPTDGLPHRLEGLLSIDHIAVPATWTVTKPAYRVVAEHDGKRLSDHDAYVVEVQPRD